MWIARDEDGTLCLFNDKPHKEEENHEWLNYIDEINTYMFLDSSLFPEVQWNDEEPTKVELVIKNQQTQFDKVYVIKNKSYEVDDIDTGGYNIIYISLDKNKRDKMFEKLRQENMNPKQDSPFYSSFEAGENSETLFEYFYGNWCYEYTIDEYKLENKQL